MGHRVTTLALTVGSPSVHRRVTMLRLLSVLVLILTLGISQMWGTNATVGTTLWAETWTSATTSTGNGTPTKAQAKASANCSTSKGTTMYGGASITYSETDENVYCRAENTGGGTSPELLLSSGKTWTISGIPTGGATEMTLTYSSNNTKSSVTVTGSPDGISIIGSSKSYTISNAKNASTFTLVFSCTGNTRIDNVSLTVKTAGSTPAVLHTVTLMDNNATLTEASANAGVTLPSRAGCDGYTFAGWTASWTEEQDEWTTTAPTIINAGAYSPKADMELYPVYTKTEGGGSSTIFFTPGTDTGETSVTKSGVTCTMTTMNNASYYQIYANQSGTFSVASGNITAISFTCTASGTSKYGPGNASADVDTYSYSGSTGSWEGSASSVTISSTAQIRMTALSITCSGGSTTSYISVPTCCQSLGSINGSVSLTQLDQAEEGKLKAEWTLDAVTGIGSLQMELWKKGATPEQDTKVVNAESVTISTSKQTKTYTGLDNCETYYAKLIATKDAAGTYCTDSWTETSGEATTIGYAISLADEGGKVYDNQTLIGAYEADKAIACAGETVTLTPASEDGYHFASWSVNSGAITVDANNQFTMPASAVTVAAIFEENTVPAAITITLNANATITASVNSETVTKALPGATVTLAYSNLTSGYQFYGWTVTAAGDPVDVENNTFTMPSSAVTVTADIRQMVTVTFKRNNETYANQSTYVGGTVAFPENPSKFDNDYPNFIGWAEAIEGIATSAPTLKSASDAITENVEYHAVFANAPQPVNSYEKVTTTGDLANNCKYVIAAWDAAESKYYAATGSLTSNGYYLDKENITSKVSNNIVTAPANSEVWKATVANSKVQFQNVGNSKYMSAVVNNTYTNFTLTDNSGEEYTYSVSTGAWTFTTSSLSNNKQIEYYDDSGKDYFSYYTAQDAPIYLFKQQSAYTEWVTRTIVKYTISYNANTTDPCTGTLPGEVSVVDGEDYTVSDAVLSRVGYNFIGWNTSNTATTAQTTIVNVTANATLYAVWEKIPTYDIEFSVNGAKVEALKLADQLEGTAIVFPDAAAITAASAFPTTDKKFVGWIEASSYASDVAPSFVTSATVENAGKTYYAVFADVTEGDYEKLTSATGLAAGDKLVATDGEAVGMKAWDGEKNNCQGATITIANNKITTLGDAAELILGGESGHWTLYDGEYYLYAAGASTSGSNHMKGKTQKDNACEWTISISSGDATIQSVTNSKTPYMRYNPNNGNPIFSCYSSSSSQNAVVLFKKAVTVADFVTTVAPLDHIAISGDFQTTYKKGTTLNLEGMVVTATYGTGGDARNRVLASDAYTVDLVGKELATTDDEFVVSFGGETATQAIHVYALSGIEITSAPTKTTYKAGETFVPEGLKIQATWGGDAADKIEESNIATGFTYSPTTAFENETDENINVDVTITYEDAEVAQSTTLQVTVEPLAHLVMTWNVAGVTSTSKIYINNQDKYLLALPDDPDVPAGFGAGYVFKGWTNASSVERDGSDFTKAVAGVEIDENATEAERTYHAVFAQVNAPFFKETFDDCEGTGGNDDSWSGDIAKSTVSTDKSGWANISAGGANKCIKLGASGTKGSAQTPSFSLTGSATLTFKAGAWNGNSEGTTLNISATGATLKQNNAAISSVTLTKGAWTTYTVDVTDATGTVTIKFEAANTSNNRFFLDEVEVKNGDAEYKDYRFVPSNVVRPVIELEEGTYYGAPNATITQSQGKQIFYSLDGNTWTEYTEPVALNQAGPVTLYAKAYDESEDDYSSVVSKSYTIITEIEDPTITPSKAFYGGSMEVEISHELSGTEGFTLQYSYDGENYVDYTTALTITEDKTVYAKATIGSLEAIVNANYTVGRSITYWRVTNANQLRAGQRAIIAQYVSADGDVQVMDAQSGNNCAAKASTATNNGAIITPAFVAYSITLEDAGDGMFAFKVPGGYLYAASSSSNHLKLRETNDNADGKWKIEISNTAVATITAQGNATHNLLKYNSSSDLFSCYQSGQTAVAIYVNEICTDINVSALEDNADVTVGKDATLTIDEEKTLNDIIVNSGATVTVNERLEANDVTVKDGGVLNIAENKTAEVTNLYIKAKAGASGQVTGAEQVEADGLFMDITLFTSAEGLIDADYWYSVAVPFDVDLNSGVFQADGSPMTNRVDFEVWGYNTTLRAQTQSNGWQRVSDNMMHAGKAYLIGFNPGQPNIIRLKATANWKDHLFSGTEMSVVAAGSGDHANWNGLANPTMRYIDVNKKTEVFNNNTHEWDSYDPEALSFNFVVGTAFFVQSDEAVTISNTDHGNYRAPKRVDETKCAYAVRITREDAKDFDNQIIVRASEDATGEYTQGHDMLTMNGTSSNTAALLWTENYGGKRLAIEEAAWLNGTATYELKMYAPKAGSYSISVAETKDNADLYLTYEGSIIWNISESEYTVDLGKGKTDGYGLLLQKKAPSVATGVDNVQGDNVQCTKVVIDEHVFILRGGQMYDVTGKMVK